VTEGSGRARRGRLRLRRPRRQCCPDGPPGYTMTLPFSRREFPSLTTARHLLLYTKQCSPAHSSVQLCPGSQASLAFGAALRCEAPWHSRCTLRRLLPARGSQPGRGSAGRSRPSRRRARATARPGSGGRRGRERTPGEDRHPSHTNPTPHDRAQTAPEDRGRRRDGTRVGWDGLESLDTRANP